MPAIKMLMFVLSALFAVALAGTKCPTRVNIYPCICINKAIGKKKFDTIVVCHGLPDSKSMESIAYTLKNIEMDQFLLYDSFWQAGVSGSDKKPAFNFMRETKFKEVEIVDTPLSQFECALRHECVESSIIRYKATNVSLTERSFAACSNNGIQISWASCFNKLEHLELIFGNIRSLKSDIFPDPLLKLQILNLTSNNIERYEKKIFVRSTFPELEILDLSHNNLREVKQLFGTTEMKIKHLDLSYNYIRNLFEFQYLPLLKSLNLMKNNILHLQESEWFNLPSTLRLLDLRENSITCDCSMKWVNSSLHINALIFGSCTEPPLLHQAKLRSASRFLVQRCNVQGQIGEKIKTPK